MSINALIAQGGRPIGADLPDIANMLQQRSQQTLQNNRLATQDQYTAEEHAQRMDGFDEEKKTRDAHTAFYDTKEMLALSDAQLPAAIASHPKAAAALQQSGIDLHDSAAARAYLQKVNQITGERIGIAPPKPVEISAGGKLFAPPDASNPNAGYRELASNPKSDEETFNSPAAMNLGGKPVMASVGSKGTVRPVPGATPFRVSTDTGPALSADDPHVANWAKNILDGNATLAQVDRRYRGAVSDYLATMPKEGYSPLASRRLTLAADSISKRFLELPQYQLTANGLPYLQRIDAALKVPGSVSDQDLLDSLTKLNTAGNAISDAQVKIITDGKSLADTAAVFGNKFKNGGVLSPNQRQQISKIAQAIFANYQKGYAPVYKQLTSQLKSAGIPEQFWSVPDLNNLSAQIEGGGGTGGPQTASGGRTVVRLGTQNGKRIAQYSDGTIGPAP